MIKCGAIFLNEIVFKHKLSVLIEKSPVGVFDLMLYGLFRTVFDDHFELNDDFRFSSAGKLKHL